MRNSTYKSRGKSALRFSGLESAVTLKECFNLFPFSDKRKIFIVTFVQVILGVLDLLGIAIIGVLSAVAINGIQSRPAGNKVSIILNMINLENQTLQFQATVLGALAASVLVVKTFFSIFFTRRTLFFLGRRSALLSKKLLSELFRRDILALQLKSDQEMLYALTTGMNSATVGVVGTLVLLISDAALVLILSFGLFALDPRIALLSAGLFGFIALGLYYAVKTRAIRLGLLQSNISVQSNENILQAIHTYREILVRNQRDRFVNRIAIDRMKLSDVAAEMSFLPNISKYVLEISMVFAAIFVSAIQFSLTDSVHAISVLSVFLASSSRIAPAILRIQQGSTSIKSNLANASRTMFLIRRIGISERELDLRTNFDFNYTGFVPEIEIKEVSFKYPNQSRQTITNADLKIPTGKMIAIVGPSGSGKSTLIDLMLGVLNADSGEILISGMKPNEAISNWPGAISYVPQQVILANASVEQNIVYGAETSEINTERIWKALKIAQLDSFIESLTNGLNEQVGDNGAKLSGGQRQRVGLARALYSNPLLLVLDEATSALDSETESNFSEALNTMKGERTIVLIAHRLATVKNADIVVYIEEGKLISVGTFEEVKLAVPNFATQASLLGL